MAVFCAILSTRVSTPMKMGGSRSMAFSRTSPVRAAAASTTALPSPPATRSRPRRYFLPTDIFPSPISPKPIRSLGRKSGLLDRAVAEQGRSQDFLLQHLLRILGTRSLTHSHHRRWEARRRHWSANVRIYHFTGLQHYSGPFPPAAEKDLAICSDNSPNRRCPLATSGAQ